MRKKLPIFLLITALFLFTVWTIFVVTDHTAMQAFNEAVYAPMAGRITPALTTLATWIGSLTHWYSYTPIILLLLILSRTRMNIGLPIAITLSVSAILGPVILKSIFAIERPTINQLIDVGGFGYPSGHSMNAVVFFGMCTVMVLRYAKNRPLKIGFTAFAILAFLSVGLSRLYLGVHTGADVIGGYLAGSAVICAAILVERYIRRKAAQKSETAYG